MATIDLGKIKFNWRGTYAGGTAYVPDDVVYYMDGSVGSSYMCVANTTGNAPSSGGSAHASWQYLAKGQATSPTTTQGDIIFRGASADERLAIGTAGQVLKVNSSANGLEYGVGGLGKIIQIVQAFKKDTQLINTTSFVDLAGMNPTITPTRAGSKIIVHYVVNYGLAGDAAFQLHRSIAGGSYAELTDYRGDADSGSTNATRCLFGGNELASYEIECSSGFILDDPSYTLGQAIAYKFKFCSPYHSSYYVSINRGRDQHNSTYDKRVISYMTLMEVM